jgi:hypothetical protein
LPNMCLHSFSQRELRSDLRRAGFRILHWLPITRHGDALLRWPRCAPALRAGGYFVVCQV